MDQRRHQPVGVEGEILWPLLLHLGEIDQPGLPLKALFEQHDSHSPRARRSVEVVQGNLIAHSSKLDGFSRKRFSSCRKRLATTPSTMRWSNEPVIIMVLPTASCPLRTTGRSLIALTARIAACGGTITAAK